MARLEKVEDNMAGEKPGVSAQGIESTIKKVKNVISAKVVASPEGHIEEIHVLAGPGRNVRYIARDIESSIMAAFGLQIDRRIISIAQVDSEEPLKPERRVKLVRVTMVAGAEDAEVRVQLTCGDVIAEGSSSGAQSPSGWLRLAADAAIQAISQFLDANVRIAVDDVIITSSRSSKIALVSLLVVQEGEEQVLSGSCPILYDEREAVVRATLDALNRRFSVFLNNRHD